MIDDLSTWLNSSHPEAVQARILWEQHFSDRAAQDRADAIAREEAAKAMAARLHAPRRPRRPDAMRELRKARRNSRRTR